MSASWLKNAIFYEIYPQSFYDTNGDGIGDLEGIIQKLDYVKSLGCNAIWINPCFDSPFKDAGYDVRDYKKIAPRYGTNDDMKKLFEVAHKKDIHVLLDLVPGHTSEEHEWFIQSAKNEKNEMTDRYVWCEDAFGDPRGLRCVSGEHERNASYITNFFKCQPALNYGFYNVNADWQKPIDDPSSLATREALKDIMRFWLDMGCDGFRVDMAGSLVKKDSEKKEGITQVWLDIAGTIHKEYPEMALVSEWSEPEKALNCGFDMDFYLVGCGGYKNLMRDFKRDTFGNIISQNNSYFKLESTRDMKFFTDEYVAKYNETKDKGLWCLFTCNHDTERPAPTLSDIERRIAFAFIFTMPGAPFLYYGDEIGLRFRWLPTKEGGYRRTGARTPMQWDNTKNLGFSDGDEKDLYLSVDPAADAPTVSAQENDSKSFLNFVRSLTALRQSQPDLQNYSPFEVYSLEEGSRMFAYKRGNLLLAVNPGKDSVELKLDKKYTAVYSVGSPEVTQNMALLPSQSFIVLKPEK